jgi:uncharacterized protein
MKTARNSFIGAVFAAAALVAVSANAQPAPAAKAAPATTKAAPAAAAATVTPAQTEAALRFLRTLNFQKQLKQMGGAMMQSLPQAMEQMTMQMVASMPPEQQAAALASIRETARSSVQKMLAVYEEKDTVAQFENVMARTYAKTFTAAELDQLSKFYSTPAGQKFLERSPMMMQEAMPEIMQILQPKIMAIMNEETKAAVDKAKAAEPKPATAPAATPTRAPQPSGK